MIASLKILSLLLIVGWPLKESYSAHAFYLGTLQLSYEKDSQEALLDVKVFSDDLQSALRNAFHDFQPGPLADLFSQNQAEVEAYFAKHLQININSQIQQPTLYHAEQVNDTHWLRFKFSCPEKWNQLVLTADFFMELFPGQMNVLSVSYHGTKQFARLSKQQPDCTAQFHD